MRNQHVSTSQRRLIIATGLAGLFASILVGVGEFLLHYDPQARYAEGFAFFEGVTRDRATIGHFIGVFGAPLYVVGACHIYLMLRPAGETAARIAGVVMAYGCIIGAVWIGSRATAVELVATGSPADQLALYELRYENLLQVVRVAVLVLSALFVWLCLTGRTHYPRWLALLNPIFLIILAFAIFFTAPAVGKFIMPIALNVAYFALFAASLIYALKLNEKS
ncbi:DUF6796 family protein [uncultured Tateyamaria sp.]|uniref:DUF6796 family protein n=1 Tax=uncultured Tateyamaria sp. TaxID=455651 RepID=UPI0026061FEB|nr:DUF6796 family protein [uncultured Tateyamaria sp.]